MEGTRITNTIPVVVISLLLLTASCGGMGGNGSGQAPAEKLTILEIFKDGENGVDGLAGPCGVTVSADGENVYVCGIDGTLAVFNRDTATGALSYSTLFEDGVDGVAGLDGAIDVAVSSDGKNVYVAGYVDSALVVFDRDTDTGALSYSTLFEDGVAGVDGLAGACGVTVSADGENVYATGVNDNTLVVFDR